MNGQPYCLIIDASPIRLEPIVFDGVSPTETLSELICDALRTLGLPAHEEGWYLTYNGKPLQSEYLGDCLPQSGGVFRLTLVRSSAFLDVVKSNLENIDFDIAIRYDDDVLLVDDSPDSATHGDDEPEMLSDDDAPLARESGQERNDLGDDMLLGDVETDEGSSASAAMRRSNSDDDALIHTLEAKRKRGVGNVVERRATVRYYTRMNPERVYPFLVTITKGMVESSRKKNAEQRSSGPFAVAVDTPVEVEPILPGCDCHPCKISARLIDGELVATFRVVPRVLGRLDGASLVIRQNHLTLVDMDLDVKIVKRTWVILSGIATFAMPFLSAVLKHFHVDFETQKEQGFNLYLAAAHGIFDRINPLALTLILSLVTGLLWWFARPRSRDEFWDIEKIDPHEKLDRIADSMEDDPKSAANELGKLLEAFPDYQPAHLFYAEWHYQTENYRAALSGYQRAFELGVAHKRHYISASLAASQLTENETALQILLEAEKKLPIGSLTGTMLYNMGCYYARLNQIEMALETVKRAIDNGFKNIKLMRMDPDLKPLRSHPEFHRLCKLDRSLSTS